MVKIFENLDINDLKDETWRYIENFPHYQISNIGRIKSFKYNKVDGKILRQNKNGEGYLCINLYRNGKRNTEYIHILVSETFNKKLKKHYDVHHNDNNKENNRIDNLKTKTHSRHISNHNKGINHPMFGKLGEESKYHKLNDKKIINIKIDINTGFLTQKEIAKKYNICQATVSDIKTGKHWSHIGNIKEY